MQSDKFTQGSQMPKHKHTRYNIRWLLMIYDIITYVVASFFLFFVYAPIQLSRYFGVLATVFALIYALRLITDVYRQIWRYGILTPYVRLIASDLMALGIFVVISAICHAGGDVFVRTVAVVCLHLLCAIIIRMLYHCCYRVGENQGKLGTLARFCLSIASLRKFDESEADRTLSKKKIKVAIIGAGKVGVSLAEDLLNNPTSSYMPCCFVDIDPLKTGRKIYDLPVLSEKKASSGGLEKYGIQEVVFALPLMEADVKKELYHKYKDLGYRVKVYDYPSLHTAGNARRSMREFDIEELLFRKPSNFEADAQSQYYKDKVIMITGGGGSIGSELCRQLAKLDPKTLIIVDIFENGAYDVQQELKILYGNRLDLRVEIASITDCRAMDSLFETYKPQIVINAAAHKHVPLMEHNCCEAVKNNVFGTLNLVDLAEKHAAERFIMVSTDKAVNPTNVMGATKRMCEMIVLGRAGNSAGVKYSATRFGNVLGSAGSVIPLFKRQIQNGGPITITDKRIIRYFMTIPEASQLVLQSGAMAKNGELFVLDMGKPVKILEMAENMIRLAGFEPYKDIDIQEIGLRPGEKLYEELLIESEELAKTENSMIFIERDTPLSREEIEEKLAVLRAAVETESDEACRNALMEVVPTFKLAVEKKAKEA